jgi:hypothetical protein
MKSFLVEYLNKYLLSNQSANKNNWPKKKKGKLLYIRIHFKLLLNLVKHYPLIMLISQSI